MPENQKQNLIENRASFCGEVFICAFGLADENVLERTVSYSLLEY